MGRYSLDRFMVVGQMLCGEFGDELGEKILQKIIRTLGEGERIIVPRYSDRGLQTRYFWSRNGSKSVGIGNPTVPKLFRGVLNALCRRIGEPAGTVMFKRVIVELGQGERLTVPFIGCPDHTCKGCKRSCFARVIRNETIRNQFTGFNNKELAISFDLGERQVRRIVRGHG